MKLYPAIDILGGRAVRLLHGKRDAVTDYGDPVDRAKQWLDAGARILHVVNLSGAFEEQNDFPRILERIASLGVPVQTGGGIRSVQTVKERFLSGADRVVLGTVCVEQPEVLEEAAALYGGKIVAGIDAREGKLTVRGWTVTAEEDAFSFGKKAKALGITDAVFTDVGRDGALTGVNLEATVRMADTGLNVIASGGIRSMEDLEALKKNNVYGAILGRSVYEGTIDLTKAIEEFECETAKLYNAFGADELVFLDITASYRGNTPMWEIISRASEQVFLPLTVGGGIRTTEDFRRMLSCGADKIAVNSAAIKDPTLITEAALKFGRQCVVLAVDAKRNEEGRWDVYLNGGRVKTELDAIEWIQKAEKLGAGEVLLTSMDRDGTKEGYDLELTRAAAEAVNIPVIASGGAGKMSHFYDVLTEGKADAALAASLFHFGIINMRDLKSYLAERGIAVRMED